MKKIILVLILSICLINLVSAVNTTWWDERWAYRTYVNITESNIIDRIREPVEVTFNHNGKAQYNYGCEDIRVVKGGNIEYLESQNILCNSTHVTVLFTTNMSRGESAYHYIYYGADPKFFYMSNYTSYISYANESSGSSGFKHSWYTPNFRAGMINSTQGSIGALYYPRANYFYYSSFSGADYYSIVGTTATYNMDTTTKRNIEFNITRSGTVSQKMITRDRHALGSTHLIINDYTIYPRYFKNAISIISGNASDTIRYVLAPYLNVRPDKYTDFSIRLKNGTIITGNVNNISTSTTYNSELVYGEFWNSTDGDGVGIYLESQTVFNITAMTNQSQAQESGATAFFRGYYDFADKVFANNTPIMNATYYITAFNRSNDNMSSIYMQILNPLNLSVGTEENAPKRTNDNIYIFKYLKDYENNSAVTSKLANFPLFMQNMTVGANDYGMYRGSYDYNTTSGTFYFFYPNAFAEMLYVQPSLYHYYFLTSNNSYRQRIDLPCNWNVAGVGEDVNQYYGSQAMGMVYCYLGTGNTTYAISAREEIENMMELCPSETNCVFQVDDWNNIRAMATYLKYIDQNDAEVRSWYMRLLNLAVFVPRRPSENPSFYYDSYNSTNLSQCTSTCRSILRHQVYTTGGLMLAYMEFKNQTYLEIVKNETITSQSFSRAYSSGDTNNLTKYLARTNTIGYLANGSFDNFPAGVGNFYAEGDYHIGYNALVMYDLTQNTTYRDWWNEQNFQVNVSWSNNNLVGHPNYHSVGRVADTPDQQPIWVYPWIFDQWLGSDLTPVFDSYQTNGTIIINSTTNGYASVALIGNSINYTYVNGSAFYYDRSNSIIREIPLSANSNLIIKPINLSTPSYIIRSEVNVKSFNYNSTTKYLNFTVDGTGINKNIQFYYTELNNFSVYDGNIRIISIDGTVTYTNSSYNPSYSGGIVNITLPQMSEHTISIGETIIESGSSQVGGGLGGGIVEDNSCNSLWICNQWSSCSNLVRSRTCIDVNYCDNRENAPILISCSAPLPRDRINGCVDFEALDGIIIRWKLNIFRLDILNEAIYKWKNNLGC